MAKTKISNTDLGWIFTEKLRSFEDCAPFLLRSYRVKTAGGPLQAARILSDIPSAPGASSRFKSSFGVFTFWLKIDPG